jgi:3-deoxy-manno-octulosonate cytidylyltransferase (CMP-KDO synthetase)
LSLTSAFSVIIPARMASSRLPSKPLADISGLPMVVRVAQQAQKSRAQRVVVAADDERILKACHDHQVQCVMTDQHHPSGSDRLAQAANLLGLSGQDIIVNVQGDEPLIEPELINAVAQLLCLQPECPMGTVAHEIHAMDDFLSPHVVKVVLNQKSQALYFSRATIPFWRDAPPITASAPAPLASPKPLRHVGLYSYRAEFLAIYPQLSPSPLEQLEALEQLRVLWHGHAIAVHVTDLACALGVDTPQDLERVRRVFS